MKAIVAAVIAASTIFATSSSAQNSIEKLPAQLSIASVTTDYSSPIKALPYSSNDWKSEVEKAELVKTEGLAKEPNVKQESPIQAPAGQTVASEAPASQVSAVANRESVGTMLEQATTSLIASHAAGSTELLLGGGSLNLMATLGHDASPMDQQSINVHVTYDARPVGGILNIRVELVPVFGGIGAAVRPTISREFAQAVDNFDDDFIGDTIAKLSTELATQLAVKE